MKNHADQREAKTHSTNSRLSGQQGVALLTVMLLMLILTVLGIASITITAMENKMAGFLRTGEAAASASESCLGVGVNLVRQTIASVDPTVIPAAFLSNAVPPGPVPLTNAVMLHSEIFGKDTAMNDMTNNADTATGSPNLSMTVGGLSVRGDIDRLYAANTAGCQDCTTVAYRVNCVATNVATGTASSATAVYACIQHKGSPDCSKLIM